MHSAYALYFRKIERNAVRRPSCDARSKKVRIFRPNRTIQHKGTRQNGPIIGIARSDPLKGSVFQTTV